MHRCFFVISFAASLAAPLHAFSSSSHQAKCVTLTPIPTAKQCLLGQSALKRRRSSLWESSSGDDEKRIEEIKPPLSPPAELATNGEQIKSPTLPSYKELLLFCITTTLIWISEPLLSLVDTTVVGLTQRNAVVQVAALGPATTLIDSLQYLTYFLAMATTSQLAKFLALKDYRKLQETTSQILGVAGLLGLGISALLFTAGMPLLKTMIGTSQSPELVGLAARYCWIRATVAPLAVMGMVAESSCLANVDTRTPAIAVASASIVNIVGDLALASLGMQGAAIATAIATATSTTIMLRKVKRRKEEWRQKELGQSEKLNGNSGVSTVVGGSPQLNTSQIHMQENEAIDNQETERETLDSKNALEEVPFLSLPDQKSLIDLVKLSGPMFFVMLGKIACYGAMSVRATDFGVVNLASHSIMMRVFFFFTCFGDSLSQAVQSFLPKALYPKRIDKDLKKMLKRFFIFSGCVGLLISFSSSWILTNLGSYLTNDQAVVGTIAKHSKFVMLSLLLHPFIMLTEGALTATRDLKNLVASYTITMAMHFGLLFFACSSFEEIWLVLFLFQSVRVSLFSARVIQNIVKRKDENLVVA